ncbi:MAG: carboxylesterase family protein [Acidobacteria bacterium]|nr:carboxylesterase family protein [Acidobacteriota bacterium]
MASATWLATAQALPDRPTVMTASGPVVGTITQKVAVYKGIPYAAPPVGERCWRPPAAVTPWTTARIADRAGPACGSA